MVVEATIIAAVVNAAGNILGKVIDHYYAGKRDDPKAEEEAARIIQETYETLRWNFTDGCVKVLKLLESGNLRYPRMLRKEFYPTLQPSQEHLEPLDSEFRYRMEYLRLNGVVALVAGGEYGITRLGLEFLKEARRKQDYQGVLSDSQGVLADS